MLKGRGKFLIVAGIVAVPLLSGCTGSGDDSIQTSAPTPKGESSVESRNLTLPAELMITADGQVTRLNNTVTLDVAVILDAPTATEGARDVRREEGVVLRRPQ